MGRERVGRSRNTAPLRRIRATPQFSENTLQFLATSACFDLRPATSPRRFTAVKTKRRPSHPVTDYSNERDEPSGHYALE